MFNWNSILLILLLTVSGQVSAQRMLSVYFQTGKSEIAPWDDRALNNLANELKLERVQLINIIGYTDSIGNPRANQRLSDKRAKAVYKRCQELFGDSVIYTIRGAGELGQLGDSSGRRVEVEVYYRLREDVVSAADLDTIKENDPRCFMIDFWALSYCNVKTITKSKKEYVYIQALPVPQLISNQHYFVKNPGEPTAVAQRINWKEERTGKLWWKKTRLVATIPKKSFDQFQFFLINPPPCNVCKENLFKKDTIIRTIEVYYPDVFLMDNVQVKARLVRRKIQKVRVPKEFVNEDESYKALLYSGGYCSRTVDVIWEKKRAKRKEDYLYSEIETSDNTSFEFVKIGLTSYCEFKDTIHNLYWSRIMCGTGNWWVDRGFGDLELSAEAGSFYHNDSLTGYISFDLANYFNHHELRASVGLNTNLGFYGSFRYHYHFVNFDILKLNGINTWAFPSDKPVVASGSLYAGPEIRTSYNKSYRSFVEANVHSGVAYYRGDFVAYLHGGYAKDLTNRINTKMYPYAQVGLVFSF